MGIEIFFNRPGKPIDIDVILADIASAKEKLVIASAWFTDMRLAKAFVQSKVCRKKLIINRPDLSQGPNKALELVKDYVLKPSSKDSIGSDLVVLGSSDWQNGIMHHKYIVVDESVVWLGSYNFTYQAQHNFETLARIEDKNTAQLFWKETKELIYLSFEAEAFTE